MQKRYYYLLVILLLINSACKKEFLEVSNNSTLYRQQYVNDLKTMQHFLNGIYLKYTSSIGFATTQAYPDLVADNLKPAAEAGAVLIPQYSWAQHADLKDEQEAPGIDPEGTAMNPLWRIGFQIIKNCSFVIEDIDNYRSENPELADNLKGQAHAMRALVHFKLVNVFAQTYGFTSDASHPGIPYIKTSDLLTPYRRESVAVVYEEMIADLLIAKELMPVGLSETRYMNGIAADALLARIYLFKNDYVKAKQIAVTIAGLVPLMTIEQGYPDAVFKYLPPAETETIFQLSPSSDPNIYSGFLGTLVNGIPWGFMATNDIADLLNEYPEDARSKWVSGNAGQWNVAKFPTNAAPEVTPVISDPTAAYYAPEIRSSEIFLIAAEAAANLGEEDDARFYLNAIRQRSNPAAEALNAAGNGLMDSIYKERRKELAFEGSRMFDLQRWKQNVVRKDFLFEYAKELPYPSSKAVAPIPVPDVNLMGIPQNENY